MFYHDLPPPPSTMLLWERMGRGWSYPRLWVPPVRTGNCLVERVDSILKENLYIRLPYPPAVNASPRLWVPSIRAGNPGAPDVSIQQGYGLDVSPGSPALMDGTHKRGGAFTAAGRAAVCIDFPLKLNPPALPNNYPFLRVAPISAGNSIPFPSFPKVTLWRGEGVNHGKTW